MPQKMSRLQLSRQLLASTLLLHYFFTEVRADTSKGSDAPGPSPNNGGPTTAYNDAGASGSNGGLSVTAQIVIGVVVGSVGLAASMFCFFSVPLLTQMERSFPQNKIRADMFVESHGCYHVLYPQKEKLG